MTNGGNNSTTTNNITSLARIEDTSNRKDRALKHKYFIENGKIHENTLR